MPQTRRQRQLQAPTISLLDHVDDDLLALVLSNCAETELRHAFTVCKAFQSPAAVQLHKRCCIALVGSTPQGLQSSNLGVFIKRTELVNGYPSYITAGDETIMLWHAGKRWWIHEASMVGQRYGWISVIDAALSPESVKAAWKVWDDHRKEWFEAPGVRVLVDMVEPTRRFWNSTTREWLELSHLCIFEAPRHAPPGHERRI